MIINNIYHRPTLPPLSITGAPFYDPHRNICIQKYRIAVGSVLITIFNNVYISNLKNKVFNTINKPNIYLRYIDDILLTNSTNEINIIHETFQIFSVLNFTQEININNKIPFLNVLIDTTNIDWFIPPVTLYPTETMEVERLLFELTVTWLGWHLVALTKSPDQRGE